MAVSPDDLDIFPLTAAPQGASVGSAKAPALAGPHITAQARDIGVRLQRWAQANDHGAPRRRPT